MAKIITVTGTIETVYPKNGKDFQLDELQKIIGGLIDIVRIDKSGEFMVINDEGKLNGMDWNMVATTYAKMANAIGRFDYIAGDVLVCDKSQIK